MTKEQIIEAVQQQLISVEDALVQLKALEPVKAESQMYVKANPANGSISLYGLGRMPITLFRKGWERLLAGVDRKHVVLAFIDAHSEYLPREKGETVKSVPSALIGEGKPFRIPKDKPVAA